MKLNKMTKLGITLLSASLLGGVMANVAPVLIGGNDVVQAETTDENEVVMPTPKMDGSYRVRYTDVENKDIAPPKEGLLKPGESIVEKPIHIPGFIPLEEGSVEIMAR